MRYVSWFPAFRFSQHIFNYILSSPQFHTFCHSFAALKDRPEPFTAFEGRLAKDLSIAWFFKRRDSSQSLRMTFCGLLILTTRFMNVRKLYVYQILPQFAIEIRFSIRHATPVELMCQWNNLWCGSQDYSRVSIRTICHLPSDSMSVKNNLPESWIGEPTNGIEVITKTLGYGIIYSIKSYALQIESVPFCLYLVSWILIKMQMQMQMQNTDELLHHWKSNF